ncbi:hypothetical protein [Spiroplasma ixodetis]|uniref:Uncharacterized protein n=1 Tax=Spiroplasma ixodetis TaxID=2141 RepID=A0ABM8BSG6_9MOLU|nr:hypothetical protein [Spiroplasma ixodetis]BDT02797.1 hypothetical protein SHM_04430 [Spiroplasma ixodetis]
MLENEDNVQQTTEPLTENNAQQEIENKVNEAENKLNKLNQEIKEKEIINIFKKYQVKTEFYDFLKFKTHNLEKAFLPLCTILILSHKCWEKPIYGLLPTFLNQT